MLRYYKLHEEFPEYSNNFRFASKSSQEILDRFVSMIYGVALITWRLSFETRYIRPIQFISLRIKASTRLGFPASLVTMKQPIVITLKQRIANAHHCGHFHRGAFLPLPAYDAHGCRILLERCANGLPLDLIDANCHVIPWSFTQMLYSDKQTQVRT